MNQDKLSAVEVMGMLAWRLLLAVAIVAMIAVWPHSADARGPDRGAAAKHGKHFPHKTAGRCRVSGAWIKGCK